MVIYPHTGIQIVDIDGVVDRFIWLFSHKTCFKQLPLSWAETNIASIDTSTFRDTVFICNDTHITPESDGIFYRINNNK